jgi:hypothetical protein
MKLSNKVLNLLSAEFRLYASELVELKNSVYDMYTLKEQLDKWVTKEITGTYSLDLLRLESSIKLGKQIDRFRSKEINPSTNKDMYSILSLVGASVFDSLHGIMTKELVKNIKVSVETISPTEPLVVENGISSIIIPTSTTNYTGSDIAINTLGLDVFEGSISNTSLKSIYLNSNVHSYIESSKSGTKSVIVIKGF